jgi:hypothetical protein
MRAHRLNDYVSQCEFNPSDAHKAKLSNPKLVRADQSKIKISNSNKGNHDACQALETMRIRFPEQACSRGN